MEGSRAELIGAGAINMEVEINKTATAGTALLGATMQQTPSKAETMGEGLGAQMKRDDLLEEEEESGWMCHPERVGLFHWVDYLVHVPEHVPIIPHSEGRLMWDNFFHHQSVDLEEGGTPALPPLWIRIIVLLLLFLCVVGPCLGYASVGALSSQLSTELGFTDAQVSFLFAVYCLPNMVAVFVAGILVDKIGWNLSLLLFTAFFVGGNLLVLEKSYFSFVVGRMMYGMGTECIAIVQSSLIARWFSHDPVLKLSTANAFCMLSFRIGALISMFFLPYLTQEVSIDMALGVIALFAIFSGVCSLILMAIDKRYEEYLKAAMTPGKFSWSALMQMPATFWTIVAAAFFFYAGAVPIISFINAFLQEKWGMPILEASTTSSAYYFAATVCLVPIGMAVDKYGHRCSGAILTSVLVVVACGLLGYTTIHPALGIVLLGIAYSAFPGILWPSVPLIVDGSMIGTAYGTIGCSLNIGLFVSPVILGGLRSSMEWTSYEPQVFVLMAFSIVALALAILLWILDHRNGSPLELSCVLKLPSGAPSRRGLSTSFISGGKRKSSTVLSTRPTAAMSIPSSPPAVERPPSN